MTRHSSEGVFQIAAHLRGVDRNGLNPALNGLGPWIEPTMPVRKQKGPLEGGPFVFYFRRGLLSQTTLAHQNHTGTNQQQGEGN